MVFACKYKYEFIKHSEAFKNREISRNSSLFSSFGCYTVGIMLATEEAPEMWNIDGSEWLGKTYTNVPADD